MGEVGDQYVGVGRTTILFRRGGPPLTDGDNDEDDVEVDADDDERG